MVDRQFSEASLAALYDRLQPPERRDDLGFYLPRVMSAEAVLDVGCGTGALLHRARKAGHNGRLVGLDPARGMLDVARTRSDIAWIQGDLSSVAWDREFDLIVMTGHAFQVFLDDEPGDHHHRKARSDIPTLSPLEAWVIPLEERATPVRLPSRPDRLTALELARAPRTRQWHPTRPATRASEK